MKLIYIKYKNFTHIVNIDNIYCIEFSEDNNGEYVGKLYNNDRSHPDYVIPTISIEEYNKIIDFLKNKEEIYLEL